jgi:N-acetylmuramoyl-L-alanine amidase
MATRPPTRHQETRELIERVKARRHRRRATRIGLASVGLIVVLALIVAAVLFITGELGDSTSTTSATDSSTAPAAVPTSARPTTSTSGTTTTMRASTTTSTKTTSTTMQASTTTAARTTSTTAGVSTTRPSAGSSTTSTTARQTTGLVVCIDPGHQAHGDSSLEPVGPGSSDMKAKVSDGTAGVSTGTAESQLVLAVSLKLRDALASKGIKVVMTRTTQDVRLSNIERAQIANQAHADLFIRIHADGSEDHSVAGIHVLYPASIKGWTDDIAQASKQAATIAQRELIAATGAKDRGIDARSDMTGFNWSDVPVILPEIGFMSNSAEDRLLATPGYQDKIVAGLTRAVLAFLGVK